jgi:hypothetical protein
MPTYSYSAARGSDLDKARELLGGCDISSPEAALRSDEDIQAILDREKLNRGVAWLAAALYAEYAQQPVRVSLVSGLTVDYSDRIDAWDKLAAPLRALLAAQGQRQPPTPMPRIGRIAAGDDAANKLR